MTLSLFTLFLLHTHIHFITYTHTERQPLSLNKSDKPPWWLLWPIRAENNMAGIRQLQSPRQAGLQSAVKGHARTPEKAGPSLSSPLPHPSSSLLAPCLGDVIIEVFGVLSEE